MMTRSSHRDSMFVSLLLSLLVWGAGLSAAMAQEYPVRPIRILLPVGQGGSVDVVSRIVAQKLGTELNQQVLVENRAGANGVIAVQAHKALPADGHALLVITPILAAVESFSGPQSYDYRKDFEPVALAFSNYFYLAVKANGPFNSVAELIKVARANPGKFNYGMATVSIGQRLGVEMLKKQTAIDLTFIPYKAQVDALTALRTGQTHLIMGDLVGISPLVASGELKFIAIASKSRSPNAAEIPTVEEAGGPRDFVTSSWVGFVTHVGVSSAIVTRLNRSLNSILQDPEMKAFYQKNDLVFAPTSPADFRRLILTEAEIYNTNIRGVGLKVE